jgi:hypothetical protein
MQIAGNCPMGCGGGLILSELGEIFCADLLCPRPAAAAQILADAESEHIVTFTAGGFTIRHPLRERLDDALLQCELHEHLASRDAPLMPPGTYRAQSPRPGRESGWYWEQQGTWSQDPPST